MITERVKFYIANGMACGDDLYKAEKVIQNFDEKKSYTNVNQIIEFYNITLIFQKNCFMLSWSDEKKTKYKAIVEKFQKYIGKYFNQIDDKSFLNIYKSIEKGYQEYFWILFEKYKVYSRVTDTGFKTVLNETGSVINYVLQNKGTVDKYDTVVAEHLYDKEETAEIILNEYLAKKDLGKKHYFPTTLKKEEIVSNYIESDETNLNYIKLVMDSLSSNELRLSDKIKLKAKQKYETEVSKFFGDNGGFKYGAQISFTEDQEKIIEFKMNGAMLNISYSKKWFDENTDYSILLIYNFIHVFGFVDNQIRLCHVSKPDLMGVFEKCLGVKGKFEYPIGIAFEQLQITAALQMIGYNNLLKEYGIEIEYLCKWFFENYLSNEFGVEGFKINISSKGSTFLEKCRTLISEIDSILKQFRLWIEDKEVNFELLEMSSSHILFKDLKSLMENKYVYPNSEEFQTASFLLCSDQSMLNYISKVETSYSKFYEMITRENVKFSYFEEFQEKDLNWLLEHDYILINENGFLKCNIDRVWVIDQLFCNQVISFHHAKDKIDTIIEMAENKIIKLNSTLFSIPEQNYLNYLFNKSEFSNGLDLRNRYTHGTQNLNEKKHEHDYFVFLRVLVIIILKINDELCLFYEERKE